MKMKDEMMKQFWGQTQDPRV